MNHETFKREWSENTEEIYKIQFFVKGTSYKLFGTIACDRHLFGTVGTNGEEGPRVLLFGADSLGNDLFSRILYGSQISLTIPFAGTLVSFVLGIMIGGISGYFMGVVDNVIQRIIEVLSSLPTIPL